MGNRKTFTFSAWVKRGMLGTDQDIFHAYNSETYRGDIILWADNTLSFRLGGTASYEIKTTQVLRDPSARFHLVCVLNTVAGVAGTDKMRMYINGAEVTSFSVDVNPVDDYQGNFNQNYQHEISSYDGVARFFDGVLSDVYFVDGQALTPSSFGYTCSQTGQWLPKPYTGSYGTNGFHLKFENSSALGEDSSGNGNNWTLNGGIVAANQLTDVPGKNFCTLNPIIAGATGITKGNLTSSTTAVRGTFDCSLFDSYWEVGAGASAVTAGTITEGGTAHTTTVTANKIFAFELSTAGTLRYRNVTDSGSWTDITTGLSGSRFPYGVTAAANWNFGQRTFVGTPEGGFKALNTQNLSLGNTVTTSGTFTGNASADGPFVWMNGAPETLTINGNAVTWGTHADKTAGGFKLRTSSSSYNASGSNTWTATVLSPAYKSLFKYQNAKSN